MPNKQKKDPNGLRNGPLREGQVQPSPGGSSDPRLAATTNYREIHQNEKEALRSIYGDDFEDVETKRSAWHVS